jgi:hypothetical protein
VVTTTTTRKEKKKTIPKIVATFVYASSQGQRTHSEGLGEMFEGDSAETCARMFLFFFIFSRDIIFFLCTSGFVLF